MTKSVSSGVKTETKGVLWTRRVMAVLFVCLVAFVLIMEIFMFCTYVVPAVSIEIFQMAGLGFDEQLTVSEFSVNYACVMFMMWVLPSLFFVIVMGALHYKFFMFLWRKILRWCKTALKGTVLSEEK